MSLSLERVAGEGNNSAPMLRDSRYPCSSATRAISFRGLNSKKDVLCATSRTERPMSEHRLSRAEGPTTAGSTAARSPPTAGAWRSTATRSSRQATEFRARRLRPRPRVHPDDEPVRRGIRRRDRVPLSTPPAGRSRCDNSAGTGGAILPAAGIAYRRWTAWSSPSGERPWRSPSCCRATRCSGAIY